MDALGYLKSQVPGRYHQQLDEAFSLGVKTAKGVKAPPAAPPVAPPVTPPRSPQEAQAARAETTPVKPPVPAKTNKA